MDSNFEIRRQQRFTPPASAVFTQPTVMGVLQTSTSRGMAVAYDASLNFVPCDVNKTFVGFLTRDANTVGPILDDIVFPGRLALPEKYGNAVTAEGAEELDVEGVTYLVNSADATSTGFIATSTAVGTGLNFFNGKFRVAQGTERVEFVLAAQLTPLNGGYARIRVVRQGTV